MVQTRLSWDEAAMTCLLIGGKSGKRYLLCVCVCVSKRKKRKRQNVCVFVHVLRNSSWKCVKENEMEVEQTKKKHLTKSTQGDRQGRRGEDEQERPRSFVLLFLHLEGALTIAPNLVL